MRPKPIVLPPPPCQPSEVEGVDMEFWFLVLCFFLIAAIYSSVGFGGGSSYLALLALPVWMLTPAVIRPVALLCNVVVVTGSAVVFLKKESFKFTQWWPYLLPGVPMAWLGGYWKLSDHGFYLLLGITLVVAAVLLWINPPKSEEVIKSGERIWLKVGVSGGVGLLSGLVSIGGGIFLSPIMHLMNGDTPRRISAMAGMFILVNSISGLLGQFANGLPDLQTGFVLPLLAAVFLGGQVGSRVGAGWFNPLHIRRVTAVVVLAAALLILRDHL